MDPDADNTEDERSDDTEDDTGRDAATARTVALVERARGGDERAFGELYDVWFDRVHDLACRVTGDRSVGAEVAQDTFLQAWRALDTVRDPQVFGGWLLRIARNTALNRRRVEARTTAVDAEGLAVIEGRGASSISAPAGFGVGVEERVAAAGDPATAVADADVVALVHDAVAAMAGRDAEVLDLGLRLGLSPAEIGEAIGLNRNAANQAVHRARRGLRKAVEARVLWRGSRPACPGLDAALRKAGVDAFGPTAVPVADAHAARCERCSERRRLRLDPAALFGAIPLVAAPVLLKAKVAAALAADGVPMAGSAHAAGAPASVGATGAVATADVLLPPGQGTIGNSSGGSGRRGRAAAMLAVAAIVLLLVVVAIASAAGNGGGSLTVAPAVATTAAPKTVGTPTPSTAAVTPGSSSTRAIEVAPTSGPAGAPGSTRPPVVAPPPADPGTTTTAPTTVTTSTTMAPAPPVQAALVIRPNTRSGTWLRTGTPAAPRLIWTTSGAASVAVEGPGITASTPAGDEPMCPNGTGMWSFCNPPPGTYQYVLTARDASGAVVAQPTATLVVS